MNIKPNIYLFNPTCEYAVANGNLWWQPNRILQQMENDLGNLPQFLASADDIVLLKTDISEEFYHHLSKLDTQMPGFLTLRNALSSETFINTQKNKLLPWGWSPATHKLLAPLKKNCAKEFLLSPVSEWKKEFREIYSKKQAIPVLREILSNLNSDELIEMEKIPIICRNRNDFELAIKKWRKIMVKAPWSSSGRGLQPISKLPVHEKVWEKLMGIVKEQGYAIAEPLYEKVFDFAFQFEIKKGEIGFLGPSFFLTDKKGQYQGNIIGDVAENRDDKLKEFVEKMQAMILPELIDALNKSLLPKYYEGYFGVDLMVILENGKTKIHPCLEINVRHNMGLLSLYLKKLLVEGESGIFKIFYSPGSSFLTFTKQMEKEYPFKLQNGRIKGGFFTLSDFCKNQQFGAYILV